MSSDGIELAATYVSVFGATDNLDRSIKTSITKGQAYADAHAIDIKAKVDTSNIKSLKASVDADTSKFDTSLATAIAKAQRSGATLSTSLDLNTRDAKTSMTVFRRELAAQGAVTLDVNIDTSGVAEAVASATAAAGAVELVPDVSGLTDHIQSELGQVDVSVLTDKLKEQVGSVFAEIGSVDIDVAAAAAQLDVLTRNRRIHIGLDVDWFPLLTGLAALIALRRFTEINVGLSTSDLITVDTELATLARNRDVQLNVEVDHTTAASAVAQLDLIARNRRVELHVDSAALAGLTALGSHTVKLDVDINQASLTTVNAALDHLARDRTVTFFADLDLTSATSVDRLLDHLARRRSASFSASLDRASAARMELLLGLLARNRNINFDTDGLGGVRSGAQGAERALTAMSAVKFTGLLTGIGAIAPVVLGVVGAAAGAIGVLGVGLASLGPAAAAAAATVTVGVQGIGDAFTALSAAESSAASDGKAQADAVVSAQEQVASALENVETAQDNLTDAQKDAEDTTKDIAQAYKDASDELEDYQFKLKDAALTEKEAHLALRDAQKDLLDAKTPAAKEKAQLRLERAELRYAQAVESNRDVNDAANEAMAKGVEGSDKVVAAKDREAAANAKVTDAQDALYKANAQVAKAQQAVTDAMNSGSSAQDAAAAALAKLSPEAQQFVLAARDVKSAWKDIVQDPTQDALFSGAAEGIRDLATAAMPTLGAGMTDVATSLNGLTHSFADFWKAPENLGALKTIFAGTADFVDGLGPGLQQATTGFLSLGQAFAPVAEKIGNDLGGLLGQVGQAFTDAFQSGALTQLISTFGDVLSGLGVGLNALIDGLIQIGNIVGPTLGPLFASIGEAIKTMAPALGAIGATFATTLTALMPDLAKFISALATGLAPVLPVIGDLLQSLMTALTPLIGPLSEIAQVVGLALSQAITALAPSIGPLGTAFAALVNAVAPIIPVFAEVVSGLVQALAPALTTIFDALGPVIKQMADLLMPVFKQLQPILADVATKIGNALAKAIEQLAPLLPPMVETFGNLVLAIAPILPQLVDLAAKLLPPLIDLFIELSPVILKLTEALTWLIEHVVVPLVIPFLEKMGDTIATQLTNAGTVVKTAKDVIGGGLEGIGNFFSNLGELATKVWDGIVHGIAIAVKEIGKLLQGVEFPDWVPVVGGKGAGALGDTMVAWAQVHGAATGGFATASGITRNVGGGRYVSGPGTGTSDSVLAMLSGGEPIALSNGEFISTAQAYKNGAPLLAALNAGWVPDADFVRALVTANVRSFAGGGVVTDAEKARMGGGTVNLSIWQAIKSRFPTATLNSSKTDHDVDGGYHPKGKAIDVGPDRQVLDYLWQNRDQLAQIIFDDPSKVWYNVGGQRAEGAKARAIYGEDTMKQHGDHIHVAALSEFKDTSVGSQQPGAVDNRSDKDKVVDEIVATGKSMGASDDAITAALATGLVESNLQNVTGGPDSSTGVFQQQNFDEWTKGGTRDRSKVSDSAQSFFEKYQQTDASKSPSERAQAVQRSAYPDKYEQRMGEAGQLYKESQARSASSGGGASGGGSANASAGSAQPVFVTNWPGGLSVSGSNSVGSAGSAPGAASSNSVTGAGNSSLQASAYNPANTGSANQSVQSAASPAASTSDTSKDTTQSEHPLKSLQIPDYFNKILPFNSLFQGDAPWYMADSPESALSNLQTQATTQWESTVSDVQGFFSDNWEEMLQTGAGLLGMGASGGGGDTINVTNNGMDPLSAASAVDRVWRRRSLANQRSGGFGRS